MSGNHVDPDTSLEETTEYVTLVIAEQLFGVPVVSINDVFSPQNLTPVPLASPEIAVTATARSCTLLSRLVAVTMISSIESCAAAGALSAVATAPAMAVLRETNSDSFITWYPQVFNLFTPQDPCPAPQLPPSLMWPVRRNREMTIRAFVLRMQQTTRIEQSGH